MKDMVNYYKGLTSEECNPNSRDIDIARTEEILQIINDEDQQVPAAVKAVIPQIAQAVDAAAAGLAAGGRLIYVGAGTSGRLGVLDASECPPTYGTPPEMVQGYIAGGDLALRNAVEGAEDNGPEGAALIDSLEITGDDVVVGITASGSAAYVISAVRAARAAGAKTVGIVTNQNTLLEQDVDIIIAPIVGPEVVSGSTRMKSGTAQKLVLNMLSTAAMIKLGKVYHNRMVDLKASNKKLIQRSIGILTEITDILPEAAEIILGQANGHVKLALVMVETGVDAAEGERILAENHGDLRKALAAAGRDDG